MEFDQIDIVLLHFPGEIPNPNGHYSFIDITLECSPYFIVWGCLPKPVTV
jgi:hypothetical protein